MPEKRLERTRLSYLDIKINKCIDDLGLAANMLHSAYWIDITKSEIASLPSKKLLAKYIANKVYNSIIS